ncbi:uncharacterized protein LOC115013719 [Cottoperca gobio]|uniref:Uncharacterized protein LOC115013719 n=1 Tax=Cottoperca gobio TaxID=56716 RepID=A0A6J2QEG8_COTGO|nr:uncharacterized protein LOC115013719 [Cottoperca gobio]
MSVQFRLALLALCSLAAASDPSCEDLLKPLEDRSRVSGKWIFYAGASDNEELMKTLRIIKNSWIDLSLIPDSDNLTVRWGDKIDGKCHYGGVNSSFSGNYTRVTFTFNATDHEHVGKHLVTCPDCILWTDTTATLGNAENTSGRNFYLFTKAGKLDDTDLEFVKKQAACLNFPPEFHFGDNTDLCPDDTVAATDVKGEEQ